MAPKLYMVEGSPPCRTVLLTAKALNLTLDLVHVDLMNQQHLTPEFLKLNPQHTIPTLVESDGKSIWDSHAIAAYLVTRYGKDDKLYPKDPYKRAVVDQRLHFDSSVTFPYFRETIGFFRKGIKVVPEETLEKVNNTYAFLDKFLEGKQWLAGDEVTIADFSTIPNITSFDLVVPIDANKYPNLTAWIKRAQGWLFYDVNQSGLEKLRAFLKK